MAIKISYFTTGYQECKNAKGRVVGKVPVKRALYSHGRYNPALLRRIRRIKGVGRPPHAK